MEHLSLQDDPPTGSQNSYAGPPSIQQGPPQLPPQMFTTAAQLLELTDSETYRHRWNGEKALILRYADPMSRLTTQKS